MKPWLPASRNPLALGSLLALAACGGGGGNGDSAGSPTATTIAPATQTLKVNVVDGPLANVVVFLDKNNNSLRDSDEPSGLTDAAGTATLSVTAEEIGQAPIVALVGTDAIDADFGAVTVPYVLMAPADHPTLVTPLTTLVHRLAENTGATSAEAELNVRTQLGLGVSLFDNYSTATGDRLSAVMAAALARITQKIATNLAPTVGQSDVSAGTISAGDIARETQNMLLDKLTSIRHIAGATDFTSSCAAGIAADTCKLRLAALATYYADDPQENQLTARTIGTAVGASKRIAAKMPEAAPATPSAGGLLDWFTLTDPTNWYWRAFVASAEENTPLNGVTRYREKRTRSVAGTLSSWTIGGSPDRATDLHWNGSAWVGCATGFQNSTTVRDAQGVSTGNYCDNAYISKTRRTDIDIAGRKLADVVNEIKSYPFTNGGPYGTRYANWGPQADTATVSASLGAAVFPAGSTLTYQRALELANAPAYDVAVAARALVFSDAVAAGGDSRVDASIPCIAPSVASAEASTLEQLVAANPGKPCIGPDDAALTGTAFTSGPRNEGWGATTASIGLVGNAPVGTATTATGYYTGNTPIRVSFAGGGSNAVTFYECQQRSINGSNRNCNVSGTGTYNIEQLGDARVMTLTPVYGLAVHLDYERVFVERAGKVILGYQSKRVNRQQVRLNLEAGNAVFSAYTGLGVVGLAPITP